MIVRFNVVLVCGPVRYVSIGISKGEKVLATRHQCQRAILSPWLGLSPMILLTVVESSRRESRVESVNVVAWCAFFHVFAALIVVTILFRVNLFLS